ncbi:LysR family transcriptional regulator [Afifella sp. IM 167]|uniref:LysR family transcriptional regulator n=1 Tax=Afifella sp. IM 167 TaxID=2033586 RepID=UPI001CC9F151|nr:LysR family transcriptional regulator [Afifella sp. IM 167]MBZ8133659.1 LysR family transcriptional regulator [Afifella sp. IM 167]
MDFRALRAFVRTVERGSMTGAARDLAISQPAVTKHLRNLEHALNARLLERTSRAIRPTASGLRLYEASRGAFAALEAAMEDVKSDTGRIEGALRIFAPSCIGSQNLCPILMSFQEEHPGVAVDLILDERQVDLVYENFDLALCYGRPASQDTIARRVGSISRILVAAPHYLERCGPIETLEELSERELVTTLAVLSQQHSLALLRGSEAVDLPVRSCLRTNNAQVVRASLLAGRAPGPVQTILVRDDLEAGRLLRILPDYVVRPTELFLTYPSSRFMRPLVRAVIDYLVPRLLATEGID